HDVSTVLSPRAGATTATGQLKMYGSAVHKEASDLRSTHMAQAAELYGVEAEAVRLADGAASVRGAPARTVTFPELAAACARSHRARSVFAIYQAPAGQVMDFETGQGKVFPDFTFGAQAAEVEVDEATG